MTTITTGDLRFCGASAKVSRANGRVVIEHLRRRDHARRRRRRSSSERMLPYLDGKTHDRARSPRGSRRARRGCARSPSSSAGPAWWRSSTSDGELMTGDGVLRAPPRATRATGSQRRLRHPLWEKITTGKASRAQVIGFAFEKYHYIEGAFEHMGDRRGQRHAGDDAAPRPALHRGVHPRRHLPEGPAEPLPRRRRPALQPLPTTRALVNYLSETRRAQLVRLLRRQRGPADDREHRRRQGGRRRRRLLRRHAASTTRTPTSSIDSFIAHTNADQKLGHEDVVPADVRERPAADAGAR